MKKLFLASMLGFMLLGLAGCSSLNEGGSTTTGTSTPETNESATTPQENNGGGDSASTGSTVAPTTTPTPTPEPEPEYKEITKHGNNLKANINEAMMGKEIDVDGFAKEGNKTYSLYSNNYVEGNITPFYNGLLKVDGKDHYYDYFLNETILPVSENIEGGASGAVILYAGGANKEIFNKLSDGMEDIILANATILIVDNVEYYLISSMRSQYFTSDLIFKKGDVELDIISLNARGIAMSYNTIMLYKAVDGGHKYYRAINGHLESVQNMESDFVTVAFGGSKKYDFSFEARVKFETGEEKLLVTTGGVTKEVKVDAKFSEASYVKISPDEKEIYVTCSRLNKETNKEQQAIAIIDYLGNVRFSETNDEFNPKIRINKDTVVELIHDEDVIFVGKNLALYKKMGDLYLNDGEEKKIDYRILNDEYLVDNKAILYKENECMVLDFSTGKITKNTFKKSLGYYGLYENMDGDLYFFNEKLLASSTYKDADIEMISINDRIYINVLVYDNDNKILKSFNLEGLNTPLYI